MAKNKIKINLTQRHTHEVKVQKTTKPPTCGEPIYILLYREEFTANTTYFLHTISYNTPQTHLTLPWLGLTQVSIKNN